MEMMGTLSWLTEGGGVLRAGSDNWESATDEQPEFLYSSIWVCLLVQVYDLSLDIFSSFFLTEQGRGSQSWDLCHRTMVLGLLRKRGMNDHQRRY